MREGYAVKTALKLVGVARGTYYWKSLKNKGEDGKNRGRGKRSLGYSLDQTRKREDVVCRIRNLLSGECSCYGYNKRTAYLKWECRIRINKKKIYRLVQENGLLKSTNRKYVYRRRVDERKVEELSQMWATVIKHGYIAGGDRTFYISELLRCILKRNCWQPCGLQHNFEDGGQDIGESNKG